jgi:hypothetical protein
LPLLLVHHSVKKYKLLLLRLIERRDSHPADRFASKAKAKYDRPISGELERVVDMDNAASFSICGGAWSKLDAERFSSTSTIDSDSILNQSGVLG